MPYIKAKEIKKSEGNVLGEILLKVITEYFADQQHQKEFEEWKESEMKGK